MRPHTVTTLAAVASLSLVVACSSSDPDAAPDPESPGTPDSTSSAPADSEESSNAGSERDVIDDPPAKEWKDALNEARDEFSGEVSKIELETTRGGGLEYKIELISADTEFEVQYDADTLAKLSSEEEALGDDAAEERKKTFDPEDVIALSDAVNTARDQQAGTITSWKIEGKDDGKVQYEFDIVPAGASDDIEVEIDALTGAVIQDS